MRSALWLLSRGSEITIEDSSWCNSRVVMYDYRSRDESIVGLDNPPHQWCKKHARPKIPTIYLSYTTTYTAGKRKKNKRYTLASFWRRYRGTDAGDSTSHQPYEALRLGPFRLQTTNNPYWMMIDSSLLFECLFIYRHTAVLLCVKVKEKTMETKYYYQRTTAQHSTKSQKETRVIKVVVQ